MRNNKGQALVEFILVLPVLLAILFVIVDFGKIFNAKNTLENISSDVIELYKKNITLDKIKEQYPDIETTITTKDDYTILNLRQELNIMTPGLNIFIDDPYPIVVERMIPNESK